MSNATVTWANDEIQEPTENIALCINCHADISPWQNQILEAVKTNGELPEDIADLFTLEILVGYNPDGSNRGVLDYA